MSKRWAMLRSGCSRGAERTQSLSPPRPGSSRRRRQLVPTPARWLLESLAGGGLVAGFAWGTGQGSMNDTPRNSDTPQTAELDALRAIIEGTAGHTGDEFFRSLVRHLAAAVGTRYAFVAVFAGGTMARTLAFWFRDRIGENIEWDVMGTSCEDVVRGNFCHYPAGVSQRFPEDRLLVDRDLESHLSLPLPGTQG